MSALARVGVAEHAGQRANTLSGGQQQRGAIARDEMFRAFNMGVGMVVITAPADADAVTRSARHAGMSTWTLGRIARGGGQVILA